MNRDIPANRRDGGDQRSRVLAALLIIVLVGLGVRVWYAVEALHIHRFVDEKYSLLNIRAIVTDGTLEPASSYYPYPLFNVPPAALVAGSEVLHEWTGNPSFDAIKPDEFGQATFLLTRLVQTLYGALALILTYLIGRKLFSSKAGLIGALALTFMPWHIHASGYFKPDAQLVAMVLLAFYWSLEAIELPNWRNHLLAGIGIALAMSTKLTGGVIAIPLVIGTLASDWRDKRRLGLLGLAGITSAGLFVLLNPYWRYYPVWLSGLEKDYAMRAAREGMTRFQVPSRVMGLITDPYVLGPLLGALGLAAFVFLAIRLIRSPADTAFERAQGWMFLSFPLVYTSIYAWKTAYFKDNNFLPLIPFFCLLTGWALIELWKRAEKLWPVLERSPTRVVATLSMVLVLLLPGLTYTYRTTTPTTLDRALAFLGRQVRPATGKLVLVEELPVELPVWEGRQRFGRGRSRVESVPDWQSLSRQRLDLADGSVVRQSQVAPDWVDQFSPSNLRLFEPRLFRLRGPALVAAHHDWHRAGKPITLPIRRCSPNQQCRAADLPSYLGGAEQITLVVTLGFARGTSVENVATIQVGDRKTPLLLASSSQRGATFVTEKFTPPDGAQSMVFVARKELLRQESFKIQLHRWREGGTSP